MDFVLATLIWLVVTSLGIGAILLVTSRPEPARACNGSDRPRPARNAPRRR